jgi:hypothetical protein
MAEPVGSKPEKCTGLIRREVRRCESVVKASDATVP